MVTPRVKLEAELLTAAQFADLLGVNVRTLRRLLARGTIPQPIRYNRRLVRWKRSVVKQYIDDLR